MKRIFWTIGRRKSQDDGSNIPNGDSPEATIARGVRLFCESGGPNNQGEEVLHLPVIVEAAESSPAAASEAATRIRKFLSKDNFQRAYVQYNAIMLVRILADNPGKPFTRNLDLKFTTTVKELLRDGCDASVQQILRETLENFETSKTEDETLTTLRNMWRKEKVKSRQGGYHVNAQTQIYPPALHNPNQDQNYFASHHRPQGLPPPHELAQRIEEARTSSKLLVQVVQSTPPHEVMTNELIKEFVDRCTSASRAVQGYINSENPPPDESTLLTLIETNDQLSMAMSRYQRAMLQARRLTGVSPNPSQQGGMQEMPSNPNAPNGMNGPFNPPAAPPPSHYNNGNTGTVFGAPPPSHYINGNTGTVFGAPPGPPPSQQRGYGNQEDQQPNGIGQTPTNQSEANPFDDPRHETAPAPADYGLPPNTHAENPSQERPSDNLFGRKEVGSGYGRKESVTSGYGREEEAPRGYNRNETRVDDSDDDDDDDDERTGRMRGGQVQYRF